MKTTQTFLMVAFVAGTVWADCNNIENRIEEKANRVLKNLETPPAANDDVHGQNVRSARSKRSSIKKHVARQARTIAHH